MKKLILLIVLIPFMGFAKFYKGTVTMNDNSLKKGFIELPDYPDDKNLKFRNEERGKTEKFEIESVKGFEIINNKNEISKFITIFLASPKIFTKDQFVIDKKKSWARIEKEGKINLYSTSVAFSPGMAPSGGSISGSSGGISYYIKKGTDNYAYLIHEVAGGLNFCPICSNQMKKRIASIFEKDCPKLADLIIKDDIKKNGYIRIVELYEENCGK